MPLSRSSSTSTTRCRILRPNLSSFQTTRVSPADNVLSSFFSPGLSDFVPLNRGKISEEDTTETPMYVNRGGRLTILQEDQGQLLTLAGEPDGKLRAAGR